MLDKIVTDQDKLAEPCTELTDLEARLPIILEVIKWVADKKNNALGLAAPQIGIQEKWFVMRNPGASWAEPKVIAVINPIMKTVGPTKKHRESCFSAPGQVYEVARKEVVRAKYTDEQGRKLSREFSSTSAQIFQHEYDHIMGQCIFHKGVFQGP